MGGGHGAGASTSGGRSEGSAAQAACFGVAKRAGPSKAMKGFVREEQGAVTPEVVLHLVQTYRPARFDATRSVGYRGRGEGRPRVFGAGGSEV